ncbi:MAG: GNAT family N-acetyltransferase [Magnetococcales bacterium]|nr:GNAT family N-acetyltransferase [Magnetococcales bacterium]|tara:strand:- start:296 stop:1243 length:948 start_codon:yes stop_codon:yes gene_type:complete
MLVKKYDSSAQVEWDEFVRNARNSTFLFMRSYMDYHADRFTDHSLLFYSENGRLIAILPATQHKDGTIKSHGGLTYGGFLLAPKTSAIDVVEAFKLCIDYYKNKGYKKLIYKPIPFIYHTSPSQDDIYALHTQKAEKIQCGLSSSIDLLKPKAFSKSKKQGVKNAKKNGVEVLEAGLSSLDDFVRVLNYRLEEKHGAQATHTLDELILLMERHPKNIKLYVAMLNDEMVAGVLMFYTNSCAHVQYIATTERGRNIGALDYVIATVMSSIEGSLRWFDFGVSTEGENCKVNGGLLAQKEMFGARSVVYETYEINLT